MIELVRPILDAPFFYELYNTLIGADYRSRVLVRDYIHPSPDDRILDIGCGPGNFLPFLPDCQYVGVDTNESYISCARRRFGHRAAFSCERVSRYSLQQHGSFDIVLALGLLHHIDDSEAHDLFQLAYSALKPRGRLVTLDGCYREGQSAAERYLLSRDRGRYVRTEAKYREIADQCFGEVRAFVREDVLRIPYSHLILECVR